MTRRSPQRLRTWAALGDRRGDPVAAGLRRVRAAMTPPHQDKFAARAARRFGIAAGERPGSEPPRMVLSSKVALLRL